MLHQLGSLLINFSSQVRLKDHALFDLLKVFFAFPKCGSFIMSVDMFEIRPRSIEKIVSIVGVFERSH